MSTLFYILISNIVPLIGFTFLQWSPSELFLAFWAESVAIGVVTELKLFHYPKSYLRWVFPLYFGLLLGSYLYIVFMLGKYSPHLLIDSAENIFLSLLLFFVISLGFQLYSYTQHFLRNKEYKITSHKTHLTTAYVRILPIHIAIIASIAIGMGGQAIIICKLISDYISYQLEKRYHTEKSKDTTLTN